MEIINKAKKFVSDHARMFVFVFAMLAGAFLIMHFLLLGNEYASTISEQAERQANLYMQEQSAYINEQTSFMKNEADFYAYEISSCENEDDFSQELNSLKSVGSRNANFVDLLYIKNGNLFGWDGEDLTDYPEILELKDTEITQLSKIFQFGNYERSIAVVSKTEGDFCDKIVVVFSCGVFSFDSFEKEDCVTKAEFTVLIKSDGRIVERVENTDTFELGNDSVQDGIIATIFQDYDKRNEVGESLFKGETKSFAFSKDDNDYFFSVSSFGAESGNLALISVYNLSKIYSEGYALAQGIWLAVFSIVLIVLIILAFIISNKVTSRREIKRLEMVDEVLDCATPKKFRSSIAEILSSNAASDFACISLTINNFKYIGETFGEDARNGFLKYVAGTIRRSLTLEEVFAYAKSGKFLLLLCNPDTSALKNRLNALYFRISEFDGFSNKEYKTSVSLAVYEIEKEERQNIEHIIEKLKIVEEGVGVRTGDLEIGFYKDAMQESYVKRAEIEGKMETALKNSEFHLFYQPKYNLKAKKIDGSEILVRWYDTKLEQYRVPDEFIPIFENNGFIVKMDHFVYFKACENISNTIKNRKICYPISVNVSRVTAIQPDFIDYYVRIKKKFGIKDNFITIEFTESFAYENYSVLCELINKLHENGILCSIDDFGTGYSSYSLLKSINVDEIKLDKFFLSKGFSEERDKTLLASVVTMVKSLGIKTTQEGIETEADFRRLEELKCDVIQGYYFAKPMKYVDYREFVEKNFG